MSWAVFLIFVPFFNTFEVYGDMSDCQDVCAVEVYCSVLFPRVVGENSASPPPVEGPVVVVFRCLAMVSGFPWSELVPVTHFDPGSLVRRSVGDPQVGEGAIGVAVQFLPWYCEL